MFFFFFQAKDGLRVGVPSLGLGKGNRGQWKIGPVESMAKTLFMVAMTRARKNLYISHYGYPSDYLDAFKSNCSHIDISTSVASQSTTNNNKNNPWGF